MKHELFLIKLGIKDLENRLAKLESRIVADRITFLIIIILLGVLMGVIC